MIYERDGVEFTNPLRMDGGAIVYNPTAEQLESMGYKPKAAESVVPSLVRKYSKHKIVAALGVKFESIKNVLAFEGWLEYFTHAPYILSTDKAFEVIAANISSEERAIIESKCLFDDEQYPLSGIDITASGTIARTELAVIEAPTDTDENAKAVIFPATGRYFTTTFDEADTDRINITPPVMSKTRPYVSWQFDIINSSEDVTQFSFLLGNLDIIVSGQADAGYAAQLFEFYYDGEKTRVVQRGLLDHVVEYNLEA